jgi:sugar/nucleoside kinase (ribokinase family)
MPEVAGRCIPTVLPAAAQVSGEGNGVGDIAGAGDAFCAGFLAGWLAGGSPVAAAQAGLPAAARAIATVGARPRC